MPFYDYRDEPEMLRDAAMRAKPQSKTAQDALVAKRLGDIYGRHPYMQAGVALSLAEAGADMAMVDQVANKSAMVGMEKARGAAAGANETDETPFEFKEGIKGKLTRNLGGLIGKVASPVGKSLSWLGGNTLGRSSKLKTASRWAVAGLQFPAEYIANYGSLVTDPDEEAKRATASSRWTLPTNMFASTSLGAMLQHGDDSGEGFFVGGEAEKKRVEKVKKFRWQVNGESYTVGRGTANMVATPGSESYKFISGLIDGAIGFFADPSNVAGKTLKGVKAARAAVPVIQSADEIAAASKMAKGAAGLLSTAEQHAIDTSKFFNWLDNSKFGQRIVTKATDETDAYRMLEAFDFRISVDDAKRLADARTTDEVRGIIGEAATRLKDETEQGMVPFATDARQLPITKKIPAYRLRANSRWLSKVPDQRLIVHGTPEERIKAVKNVGNYLKTIKVDPYSGDGKKLMDAAIEAFSENGTRVNADVVARTFLGDPSRGLKGIVHMALESAGQEAQVIDDVLEQFRSGLQTLRKYATDSAGLTDDNGFMVHMTQFMDDDELYQLLKEIHPTKINPTMSRLDLDDVVANLEPGELSVHGPMALSQMLNNVVILPDPNELRRMTTNPFFRVTKDGKQLAATKLLTYLQQEVWRPYALMSVGYMVRNTMDATMRLGLHGYLSNPIDYILMGLGRRGLGTVNQGELWSEAGEAANQFTDVADFNRWMRRSSQHLSDDPAKSVAHLIKTDQVAVLEPSDLAYGQGLVDNGRLIHASPELRFYAQIMHLPIDRQHQLFVKWLDQATPESRIARKTIVDYLIDGPVVANRNNGRVRSVGRVRNAETMTTDELVEAWFEKGGAPQVDNFTQGTDELRAVVAYNDVPIAPSEIWDESMVASKSVTPGRSKPGDLLVEDITIDPLDPQFNYWRILEVETLPGLRGGTRKSFKVIPVTDPGAAMADDAGSPAMNAFIRDLLEQNAARNPADPMRLPARVMGRVRTKQAETIQGVSEGAAAAARAVATPARWFFENVVSNWERAIDKSPAFKMAYYRAVAENARLLTPAEADLLMQNIDDFAKARLPKLHARNPEKARATWMGGKENYDDLKAAVDEAKTRGDGVGTVQQLQDYSSTRARRDLEDLFFQSVEKSNIAEATQLIAPFGAAWANIVGRYSRELIENPFRVRKAQLVYRGLEQADPDQDGRGYIWKDPTTGQMKFTFPFSGQVINAVTGIPGISMAAPVSRLSAGFSAIPAFGPMVQIAASDVFDRFAVPGLDEFRRFVTPFGDVGLKSMVPGSLQKAFSALADSPDRLETMYGNTYNDVFAHLSASGEYDLTDSNERNRLNTDAKMKARYIAMIRAIGQFVGPTAPSPDYRFKTGSGQYYFTSEMINWYRDEQAKNYDTAVGNFLDKFGDQPLIYTAGKTEVMEPYAGIDATEQFQRWERENADLLRDHKETAGYLAPGGTEADFSMPVWSRQIAAGMRRRIDPMDRLAVAQYTVAAAEMRARRKEYGPDITSGERAALKEYRQELVEKYPGFVTAASFDTKGFDNMLLNLRELMADPRTEGNSVVASAAKYLRLRDQAALELEEEEGVTLRADKNARAVQLKNFLYSYGEELAAKNPDFSRLWQRELSAEVED
jgi:hypothetical protein